VRDLSDWLSSSKSPGHRPAEPHKRPAKKPWLAPDGVPIDSAETWPVAGSARKVRRLRNISEKSVLSDKPIGAEPRKETYATESLALMKIMARRRLVPSARAKEFEEVDAMHQPHK
jgi:hypothetical protein